MSIIEEIEKVVAELPLREAGKLTYWLNEFKAARRYKKFKEFAPALKALADFKRSNSSSLWN